MTTGPQSPQPPFDPSQQPGPPPGQQPGYQPGYQPGPPTGYQPGPPMGYGPAQPPMRPDEEKLWAIAAHLGPLILGFIAPLVVWLVFRDRSAYLERTAKEALNFQITLLIGFVVSAVLIVILIGLLLMALVGLVGLVLMILATVKVANLEDYRYPFALRLIK